MGKEEVLKGRSYSAFVDSPRGRDIDCVFDGIDCTRMEVGQWFLDQLSPKDRRRHAQEISHYHLKGTPQIISKIYAWKNNFNSL